MQEGGPYDIMYRSGDMRTNTGEVMGKPKMYQPGRYISGRGSAPGTDHTKPTKTKTVTIEGTCDNCSSHNKGELSVTANVGTSLTASNFSARAECGKCRRLLVVRLVKTYKF